MKKHCKECPWIIKNNHNEKITSFSKRLNKSHNCHMSINGGKNMWDVKESTKCFGRKQFEGIS